MSIEDELMGTVEAVLSDLSVSVRLDRDNDLEVSLSYKGRVISSDFVDLRGTFELQLR